MGVRIEDKHILVVDDDAQILFVWRGALSMPGWYIETAQNGEDALALVRQKTYDLVVTDIKMPLMNGTDLTKAIRAFNQEIPVIWITCFDYADMESDAACLYVYCCLSKPLSITNIRKVVYEAIGYQQPS